MIFRSLNALRVLAEFWVVHAHTFHYMSVFEMNKSLDLFVSGLMSFFFVLSGFVMTHAHMDDDFSTFRCKKAFWCNRLRKMYPVYFVFWLYDFIHQICGGEFEDDRALLVCRFMQVPMLNSWMGCSLSIANLPSWFMATLWWIWFVFPWLLPLLKRLPLQWPWTIIIALNAGSFAVVVGLYPRGYWYYAQLPPLRGIEFFIGCVTATTLKTRVHWSWPLGAAVFLVAFYAGVFYTAVLVPNQCHGGVWSFLTSLPFTDYCMLEWAGLFTTKFAFIWAILIHWFAASEFHDVPNRTFLFLEESHLLQTLSTFSIQLYLGHYTIFRTLMGLSQRMLFRSQLGLHTVFILIYGSCYLFKLYIQPYLDGYFADETVVTDGCYSVVAEQPN